MRAVRAASKDNRSAVVGRASPAMRLVTSNGSAPVNDGGSSTNLLERDAQLGALASALSDAESGTGRVVLVHGEAGVGKSALVERFLAADRNRMRVLIGRCDALFTPQPLS